MISGTPTFRPSPLRDRRAFLKMLAAAGLACLTWPTGAGARTQDVITRKIPSSGEALPVVGLGSWVTFNVGDDPVARDACAAVMDHFF
jgi:hypothetical protein